MQSIDNNEFRSSAKQLVAGSSDKGKQLCCISIAFQLQKIIRRLRWANYGDFRWRRIGCKVKNFISDPVFLQFLILIRPITLFGNLSKPYSATMVKLTTND